MEWIWLITAICLILGFIIFVNLNKKVSRTFWLISGPNNTGKTTLLNKLQYKKLLPTLSSLETTVAPIEFSGCNLSLVDIPGHDTARFEFKKYADRTAGVLFVVDSSTVQKEIRQAGEKLYEMLQYFQTQTPRTLFQRQFVPQIIIVCNKQDILSSLSSKEIKELLAKEISVIVASQKSSLGQQAEKVSKFDLNDYNVQFIETHLGTNPKLAEKGLDTIKTILVAS